MRNTFRNQETFKAAFLRGSNYAQVGKTPCATQDRGWFLKPAAGRSDSFPQTSHLQCVLRQEVVVCVPLHPARSRGAMCRHRRLPTRWQLVCSCGGLGGGRRHRQDPGRSQNSVLSEDGCRDCGHLFTCGHSAAAGASPTPSPLWLILQGDLSFLLVPSQVLCRPVLLECGHHMLHPWGFLRSVSRSVTEAEKLELTHRSPSSQDTVGLILQAGMGIRPNMNGSM